MSPGKRGTHAVADGGADDDSRTAAPDVVRQVWHVLVAGEFFLRLVYYIDVLAVFLRLLHRCTSEKFCHRCTTSMQYIDDRASLFAPRFSPYSFPHLTLYPAGEKGLSIIRTLSVYIYVTCITSVPADTRVMSLPPYSTSAT